MRETSSVNNLQQEYEQFFNPNYNEMALDFNQLFTSDCVEENLHVKKQTKEQVRLDRYSKRTINDYKILTKEIREDYLWILLKHLSRFELDEGHYDSVESPMGYFIINGAYIEAIVKRERSRGSSTDYGLTTRNILIRRNEDISTYKFSSDDYYRYGNAVGIAKKLAEYGHSVLEGEGYVSSSYSPNLRRNIYRLYSVVDESIRDITSKIMGGDWNGYTILNSKVGFKAYRNFFFDDDISKVKYTYKGRETTLKVGKGIKKMFRVLKLGSISDEQIKQITDRLLASVTDFEFRVVTGKDIDKFYREDNYDYSFDLGSLGSSCMRHDECIDNNYFDVYKDYAKMIIFVHPTLNKIIGRAILWEALVLSSDDSSLEETDIKVMDRVYCKERYYNKFFDWASENGYYRKRYQSYDNEYSFVPPNKVNGDEISINMEINVNLDDYDNLPYMDTFAWCDGSVIRNAEDFGYLVARDTCGSLEGRREEW